MRVASESSAPDKVVEHVLATRALSPDEMAVLRQAVTWTTHMWVGKIDGKFMAAWGLAPMTVLSDSAYLWLWTPPELSYQLTFIRHSKRMVERMLDTFSTIYGVTDPKNDKAIRWLEWIGMRFAFTRDDGTLVYVIKRSAEKWTRSA